jgi:predicted Zn-ribbon and HTH transcriptional regulator
MDKDRFIYFDNPGRCCRCNSEELQYSAFEVWDDQIGYPYICMQCGAEAVEYADLKYAGHELESWPNYW